MIMSKLEKLIKELCPDGVEYKTLGEVCNYERPEKYIVSNTNYNDSFTIPVLTAGRTFILGYTNETEGIYNASKENPVIIFDDFTGALKWVDFRFKVKSSAMKMIKTNENIAKMRYVFYCMENLNFFSDEHKRLWIAIYSQFSIPVPPLPVQEEIVRILDTFTELTKELTKELTERRRQYEYYRDALLTFDKLNGGGYNRRVKLGEIAELYAGATPKTTNAEYWTNGTIPWMSSGEVNLGQVFKTEKKITQLGYDSCSTKLVPPNTVVVALAGQGKTRGTVAITRIELCTNQSLCSIVPDTSLKSDFLYHYLKGQYQTLRNISSGDGTRGGLNLKTLKDFEIPLPPLDVQERLVRVLDNFDSICSDLNIGLPAEIEARKKQYEHYRDKLLTFSVVSTGPTTV